jgi:hypothetical protein
MRRELADRRGFGFTRMSCYGDPMMKRALLALTLAALTAAPAIAQTPDGEIDALIKRWVAGFNKGDTAALAKDVYVAADEAKLNKQFADLRTDSFGKLDVYGLRTCTNETDKAKVQMDYARIYTFGGKMNDDEGKQFELTKTPAGWRITSETDTSYGATPSCKAE